MLYVCPPTRQCGVVQLMLSAREPSVGPRDQIHLVPQFGWLVHGSMVQLPVSYDILETVRVGCLDTCFLIFGLGTEQV